jgi:hypothetical protein
MSCASRYSFRFNSCFRAGGYRVVVAKLSALTEENSLTAREFPLTILRNDLRALSDRPGLMDCWRIVF